MIQVFEKLNAINVNGHTEKKNNLTYLSWAWAWAEVKKQYPSATYEIKMFDGKPFLHDENLGYMVMTSMTIEGLTHDMWLPVMDNSNKAMKDHPYTVKTKYSETEVKQATMFDVNTAIMRCLTKNIAMFGLGLYIYAGEDLPEDQKVEEQSKPASAPKIETLKILCKKHKISFEKLLEANNRTIETLTETEAAELLVGLNKKYGDK